MRYYVKAKLEETKAHAFDKKVLEREMKKGVPDTSKFYERSIVEIEDLNLNQLRKEMKNTGLDISSGKIKETTKLIKVDEHRIQIYIYKKEDDRKDRPVILFMHGGGFFGGEAPMRGNQCKLLAEYADAVVVTPEYRLAPECPYPAAVEDVLGTIDWIVERKEMLGIDADRMVVAGDSAGGNLAANCCINDKEGRIKLAVYIYAGLDMQAAEDTEYHWDYSLYEMDEGQKDYLMNRLYRFKALTDSIKQIYIPAGHEATEEKISPFYIKDVSKMPKSLFIQAEFDYFRISNEIFAKRLDEAGREVEVILYEGMDHAFFDRIGMLPQVEDCIREIAKRVKEI